MKIEPRMFTLPNGEVLTVRSLCADDAEALSAFRNAIYSETHFMARYPDRKSTRLNSSHRSQSRMPSSA